MRWSKFFRKKTHNEVPHPSLFLFNTLSKEKERFVPSKPSLALMYNCGPTVYDYQHIGNLRAYVFADVLRRTLAYNGYKVKQAINITDVGHLTGENEGDPDTGDDKMSAGLKREGKELTLKNMRSLGEKYTKIFLKDLETLNIKTEKISFPRASDFIKEQEAIARSLEEKGYAYETSDGLYYDTSRFSSYGALGTRALAKQKTSTRGVENKEKRDPSDFALWKKNENLGWDSPWGKGFPGWHLECTAMVFAKLGRSIDIHTGGIDHIPIHHNNEIAQAEAVTNKPYVRYWLHGEFITIEGQKISKSLGNTILLRQIADRGFNPLSYRYWILTGHYRTPMNFTWEALEASQTALSRLLRFFVEELPKTNGIVHAEYQKRFQKKINNDLDIPGTLSLLWELVRDEEVSEKDKRITLLDFDKVLGLGLIEGHRKLKGMLKGMEKRVAIKETPEEIQALVVERETAREAKKWEEADTLRKKIEEKGFCVDDTASGSKIRER